MTTALEQRSEANSGLGASGQPAIQFEDEGTPIGSAGGVTNVDFVGAGVTASHAAGQVTVTINGTAAPDAWPIGSVFIAVVSTNPNTLLGYGTWSAFGAGRVLVGLDAADPDFDTVGETGGSKTSAHGHGVGTIAADSHAAHWHAIGANATISAHSGTAVNAHSGTAVDAHASHTHVAGTLLPSVHSGATVGDHSTGQWDHKHNISSALSATISVHGTHAHGSKTAAFTAGASPYYDTPTDPGNHTLGGTTETVLGINALTHSVGQASAHTMSGSTGNESASLTHSVTQPTDHVVTQPGAHTLGGYVEEVGAFAHSMSGSTGSGSPSVVQPYLVCYFWQRTA